MRRRDRCDAHHSRLALDCLTHYDGSLGKTSTAYWASTCQGLLARGGNSRRESMCQAVCEFRGQSAMPGGGRDRARSLFNDG